MATPQTDKPIPMFLDSLIRYWPILGAAFGVMYAAYRQDLDQENTLRDIMLHGTAAHRQFTEKQVQTNGEILTSLQLLNQEMRQHDKRLDRLETKIK